MKWLRWRITFFCAAVVLTLTLSPTVAKAQCEQRIVGGNVWGDWECTLFDECNGWCYYHCTCTGMTTQQCDDALEEAGLEPVQGAPC